MAYSKHGRVTSVTPGIPTQVTSANTPVSRVLFQALRANTGFVGIGGRNVRVQSGEQNCISLAVPATSTPNMQTFENVNLFDLYIDVTVANEGVAYTFE
jgi:hypothetical protein